MAMYLMMSLMRSGCGIQVALRFNFLSYKFSKVPGYSLFVIFVSYND